MQTTIAVKAKTREKLVELKDFVDRNMSMDELINHLINTSPDCKRMIEKAKEIEQALEFYKNNNEIQ